MSRGSQRRAGAPRARLQCAALSALRAALRPALCASLLASALAGAGGTAAADDSAAASAPVLEVGELRSPHFGTVLFQYFQDDHFGALTRLLAHSDSGLIDAHARDAALLGGGLFLQYGLHERAESVFERLLAEQPEPALGNHAWFELGRVRYRQGDHEQALAAFARVDADQLADATPNPARRTGAAAQLPLLMAQSELALGRYGAAAERLERWQGPQHWLPWMRYNLGVALIRQGEDEAGFAQLEQVGSMVVEDDEDRALRDRANLALGYAWLQRGAPERALAPLLRVHLEGPSADRALLGLGWARSAQDDHAGALVPWQALQDREGLDNAIFEARLAVPHALSRLEADDAAARAYTVALDAFDAELERLDGATATAGDEGWLQALLGFDKEHGDGDEATDRWAWQLDALPATLESRYLGELIASNGFQEGLRNYRDLLDYSLRLDAWMQRLDAFDGMVDAQRLAASERGPLIETRLAVIDPVALHAERDALAGRLAGIRAERDVVALATSDEAFQWQLLEELAEGPALAAASQEARDKHRLLRGHLLWQLDREYGYRLWQQQRTLAALDEQLEELDTRRERVRAVRGARPEDIEAFAARIDALTPRIAMLRARVQATRSTQALALQEQAMDWLDGQRQRLVAYRVQAQFALATLHDRAATQRAAPVAGRDVPAAANGQGALEAETRGQDTALARDDSAGAGG